MSEKPNNRFPIFSNDADLWEQSGLSLHDEDEVVLALWKWWRGRPDDTNLSTSAKLVYAPITARWTASRDKHEEKSNNGRKGGLITQERARRAKACAQAEGQAPLLKPTSSSTSSTSSTDTHSSSDSVMGAGATTEHKTPPKFTPPTVEEVRTYCQEMGYQDISSEKFIAHYNGLDWMKGNTAIKDWKSIVDYWHLNGTTSGSSSGMYISKDKTLIPQTDEEIRKNVEEARRIGEENGRLLLEGKIKL